MSSDKLVENLNSCRRFSSLDFLGVYACEGCCLQKEVLHNFQDQSAFFSFCRLAKDCGEV